MTPPGTARSAIGSLVVLAFALQPAAGRAQVSAANLDRIRALPVERRQVLAENLERFERLPPAVRERIRLLDQELASRPPAEQARYAKLLHDFHVWFRGLSAEQQQQLLQLPPADRVAAVARLHSEQGPSSPGPDLKDQWLQASTLTTATVMEEAYLLKVWYALDPAARAEVDNLKKPEERTARLQALARELGVAEDLRRELRDFLERVAPLEGRLRAGPLSKKRAEPPRRPWNQQELLRRIRESRFLAEFRPEPVRIANLQQFEDEMPGWLREDLDLLPPDLARERLTILYRLVYPEPAEIPPPQPKPAANSITPPATPAPPRRPSSDGSAPF